MLPKKKANLQCKFCNKACKSSEKAIQCDRCDTWVHIKCYRSKDGDEIPEELYDLYGKKMFAKYGFEWSCGCGEAGDGAIPKLENEVNNLASKVNLILDEVKTLNIKHQKLEESSTVISNATESLLENQSKISWAEVAKKGSKSDKIITALANKVATSQFEKTQDRKERENNIMIFNAKEAGDQKDDITFFKKLCTETLGFERSPDVKMKRIGSKKANALKSVDDEKDQEEGEKSQGDLKRPDEKEEKEEKLKKPKLHLRPIKVIFPTSWEKRKFLTSLNKLKDSPYEELHVAHDMNQEDRDRNKALLDEAYKRSEALEKPCNFRYKVRGPPWAQKIVKVYQKNSS